MAAEISGRSDFPGARPDSAAVRPCAVRLESHFSGSSLPGPTASTLTAASANGCAGQARAHDERESTERLLLYIFYMYLDLGQSAIIDKKMLRRRELFPAVEGGSETALTATLRKGHRDLPVFVNELNDALELHDALLVTIIKEEAELYPLAQAR